MILGDGPLAAGARRVFGDVPFCWVLAEPPLPEDIHDVLAFLDDGELVVLSTPCPVGTCAELEALYPALRFAVIPENVRAAHPEDWKTQARFILGTREPTLQFELALVATFGGGGGIVVMSPESAEMVKHALNGFLAVSVAYAKEIAYLARAHGADPEDVAHGMMSDPRIGEQAYLRPAGEPGSHLLREVDNLLTLGAGPIVQAAR